MNLNVAELKKLIQSKQLSSKVISINDLREKEYSGINLTENELKALANYEHFRLKELSMHVNDVDFNKIYQMLQVMANLRPYTDFLKEEYNF